MPPRAGPQSIKIFPLLKGDSALGESARGMSNRSEHGHPPRLRHHPPQGGIFTPSPYSTTQVSPLFSNFSKLPGPIRLMESWTWASNSSS